jgi:hypothetical protein
VFESGRPETGSNPLTIGVEDVGLAVPGQRLFNGLDAKVRLKGDREKWLGESAQGL